jgi:hypothetical protein
MGCRVVLHCAVVTPYFLRLSFGERLKLPIGLHVIHRIVFLRRVVIVGIPDLRQIITLTDVHFVMLDNSVFVT